jgi:hypothetical protein
VAEAELNEVAEAGVPSEDGEVMDETSSLAAGTGNGRRVEVRPSVVVAGAGCAVRRTWGVAEAILNGVVELGLPNEDGEVMDETSSLAAGIENGRRVEVRPSVGVGAPEAVPVVGLPNTQACGVGIV